MSGLGHNSLPLKKSEVTTRSIFLISGGDNEQCDCQMLQENPYVPHALPSNVKDAERMKKCFTVRIERMFLFSGLNFLQAPKQRSFYKELCCLCWGVLVQTCCLCWWLIEIRFSMQLLKDRLLRTEAAARAPCAAARWSRAGRGAAGSAGHCLLGAGGRSTTVVTFPIYFHNSRFGKDGLGLIFS